MATDHIDLSHFLKSQTVKFSNLLRQMEKGVFDSLDRMEVYCKIVVLLEMNGFEQQDDGSVTRKDTGCSFSFGCLREYASVVDFQLDWPYA